MSAAAVTKDAGFECYRIRAGHESATICLRSWTASGEPVGEKTRHLGEILIHSSFGSWAYTWRHIGCPLKRFLTRVEFDYLFGKFMGPDLDQFDGDQTMVGIKESVVENRRRGGWNKATARQVWNAVIERREEIEKSVDGLVNAMYDASGEIALFPEDGLDKRDARHFFEEPWERKRTRDAPQAVGFWREIWPHFINTIKQESGRPGAEGEAG